MNAIKRWVRLPWPHLADCSALRTAPLAEAIEMLQDTEWYTISTEFPEFIRHRAGSIVSASVSELGVALQLYASDSAPLSSNAHSSGVQSARAGRETPLEAHHFQADGTAVRERISPQVGGRALRATMTARGQKPAGASQKKQRAE